MASTTVRKQSLLISANSWSLLALLKMVFFCGGSVVLRHCWELVNQCRKECYSTIPTFDNFSALLIILLFSGGNVVLRRCWWLVHQCRKNAIQQCQLLMIFGHYLIFFIFRRQGFTCHLWWLVLQYRNKGCSLVPIFDYYWHCWKFFCFLAAMLYFGTVER